MFLIEVDGNLATTDNSGNIKLLDNDDYINQPDVQMLLALNKLSDYTQVGDKYFVGDPKVHIYINTGDDDTRKQFAQMVLGSFIVRNITDSGDCIECDVFTDDTRDGINKMFNDYKVNLVASTERPGEPDVSEPPYVQETTKHTDTWDKYTQTLVPEECRGETTAFTDEYVYLPDIKNDAYCIEGNFEQRGAYWILDVIPRGMRIIHSDKRDYHHEFPIKDC